MPSEEFLRARIRAIEREEGLDSPPRVELSDRVIPASALSDSARTRIEGILAQEFKGQPQTKRTLEQRTKEGFRALGEAPTPEDEATKEQARGVRLAMTGAD